MLKKGKVLRMYDTKAVFENQETGNCVVVTQVKEGWERDLHVCDRTQLPEFGTPSQIVHLESIFGIYDLLSGSFVALVIESEPFVSLNGIEIRKVNKVLVVPLFRHGRLLSDRKQKDEDRYLQLIYLGFSEHQFFFSSSFDLTQTQQRLAIKSIKYGNDPMWARADQRFFWNREVVVDLIACNAEEWIVPFMSAYIEISHDCEVDDEKFSMLFISRRSRHRQGCRFTKRGIDESGHVANFVETEQILLFPDGKVTSFVQIRGSIPILWSSPVHLKYDPNVFIDENRPKSVEYCERHITELLSLYSDINNNSSILFINLIDVKKDQRRLGVAFEETIENIQSRTKLPLKYIWFDFHHECKQKGKWNNLSKLLGLADEYFKAQGFFCRLGDGTIKSWQVGCIRTNCMDNLDRTNVVQSLFARRSIIAQLGKSNMITGDKVMDSPWKKFEKIFKSVWANNANSLAQLYAGTGALKVDFTKTGKRTLKGMFDDGVNAIMRYYINNFTDGIKQDAIDVLLGVHRPDVLGPSPFLPRGGQEYLSTNLTKAFVLIMGIFSSLLLIGPIITGETEEQNSKVLTNYLLLSIGITIGVVMYVSFRIFKKGSKIGERLVIHPQLNPEPIRR